MSSRKKLGLLLIILGIGLVLGAGIFVINNEQQNKRAGESVENELPLLKDRVQEAIDQKQEQTFSQIISSRIEEEEVEFKPDMQAVEIDGKRYVGYISIPDLELELPIQEDWDYEKLESSPCRFTGSAKTDDLVIAGHNYRSHFKPLQAIKTGTIIHLLDMEGNIYTYEVVERQVVEPMDLDEMIFGNWDMTLFTCTYGGRTRLAVRCIRIKE